jgi:hypothetical protein
LTQGDPNAGCTHSWTDNKNNKYILRFNSEEDAKHAIYMLGYPTEKGKDVYFAYVEPEIVIPHKFILPDGHKFIIRKEVNDEVYFMTLGPKKTWPDYNWTNNKTHPDIETFDTKESANEIINSLFLRGDAYAFPMKIEQTPIKNNSPYIYVKDIKGKNKAMTLDKFGGMLFRWAFAYFDKFDSIKKYEPEVGDVFQMDPIVRYKLMTFIIHFSFRIQIFDADQYLIDILDGPREDSRVIYRVQFKYGVPVNIENHITTPFMRRCFNV